MRFIILILAAYAFAGRADASCDMVKDTDQRMYCKAKEQQHPWMCGNIADFSLRQRCYAEIGDQTSARCMTIPDQQQRAMCIAGSKK